LPSLGCAYLRLEAVGSSEQALFNNEFFQIVAVIYKPCNTGFSLSLFKLVLVHLSSLPG